MYYCGDYAGESPRDFPHLTPTAVLINCAGKSPRDLPHLTPTSALINCSGESPRDFPHLDTEMENEEDC